MDDTEDMVLTTLSLPESLGLDPSLSSVAEALGIDPADMDNAYGVVPIAPQRHLFAARVHRRVLGRAGIGPEASDPEIAPYE